MDPDEAVEHLKALSGDSIVAQVVSRGVDHLPLAEVLGILTVEVPLSAKLPRGVCVSGQMIWIWPDRFVKATPLAIHAALELVTEAERAARPAEDRPVGG